MKRIIILITLVLMASVAGGYEVDHGEDTLADYYDWSPLFNGNITYDINGYIKEDIDIFSETDAQVEYINTGLQVITFAPVPSKLFLCHLMAGKLSLISVAKV